MRYTYAHQREQPAKLILLQFFPGVVIVVLPLVGCQVIVFLPAQVEPSLQMGRLVGL